MKTLLFATLILLAVSSYATNYYVSTKGNNLNNGLSPATSWANITRVNSFSFAANDNILFNRGDTFYGAITANRSNLNFSAYGTGANPVITGLTSVTSWKNLGGSIWESTVPVSTLSTCNMVVINNIPVAMGRYPNTAAANGGYLTFTTTGDNTRLKNASLAGTNWAGADVVIRLNRYTGTRKKIISQSGDVIKFGVIATYSPTNNYGLFIENDIRTLDIPGEWYFNPSTKKLSVYAATAPVNVKLSTVDTLFTIKAGNVTIENIQFEGGNIETIAKYGSNSYSNISIRNFSIASSGKNAINFRVGDNKNIVIENGTITNTNVNGIQLGAGCFYASIRNIQLNNTGTQMGMIPVDVNTSFFAVNATGKGSVIEYNKIKNCGYVGIAAMNDSTIIRYNLVDSFSNLLDDGSGIYFNNGSGNTTTSGTQIKNNIILNGVGAPYGGGPTLKYYAEGIYLDDNSNGVELSGNTIANCAKDGILMHNARNCTVKNNTSFNNAFQFATSHNNTGQPITSLLVKNNLFIASKTTQYAATFFSISNDVNLLGLLDSNTYARPILDSAIIKMEYPNLGWGYKTFPYWQTYSGKDATSKKSYISIASISELDFQYNASANLAIYKFKGLSKKDFYGNIYNDSIAVPAWGSCILVSNGAGRIANKIPVAAAGQDVTITLPVNTTLLRGTGTDADGTITNYMWSKIAGSATATITSTGTAVTTVNNLAAGVYQFQLTVTDDKGATAADTVLLTVNPAPNLPPFANAGLNATLTLPANTVNVTGSGTDTDGSVSSYLWVKISGPASATINFPAAASSTITNLVQGIYEFKLTVTDNEGATATDTIQIVVNAAPAINLLAAAHPASVVNGLDYKYYEGFWKFLPLFDLITPIKTGNTLNFDILLTNRPGDFGFSFTGYIDIPADGLYTFFTSSDDGSSLYIDTLLIVNNDGQHGVVEKSGIIGLKAGKHAIKGLYFQGPAGKVFTVSYQGAGINKQTIPLSALYRNSTAAARSSNAGSSKSVAPAAVSKAFKISCFPNPAPADFRLLVEGDAIGQVEIAVVNNAGQAIYKVAGAAKKIYSFGNNFPPGVYIIKVSSGNTVKTLKVIKL